MPDTPISYENRHYQAEGLYHRYAEALSNDDLSLELKLVIKNDRIPITEIKYRKAVVDMFVLRMGPLIKKIPESLVFTGGETQDIEITADIDNSKLNVSSNLFSPGNDRTSNIEELIKVLYTQKLNVYRDEHYWIEGTIQVTEAMGIPFFP